MSEPKNMGKFHPDLLSDWDYANNTDIRVKIVKSKYGGNDGIEVVLGGDSELSTAIEALEFITKTLKKEVKRNSIENY